MSRPPRSEPIAIIGASLRLPGAETLDALWAHLAAGRSLIAEVPARRWDAVALRGNPSKENKTNSIWGGFIEDADCFDAAFFNITPREAAWMDPQQRLMLELAWKAIEDAGYRPGRLAGSRTGVYMGVCHWDYAELIEKHLAHVDAYWPTGIAFSIIANRISHFFDFRGPSIVNDTACAASMTSVYQAVRALQDGECDFALAGGVNLCWSPNHFIAFSKNGMLSKDGRSKAFDQRADGYVRGEGGATLLLKRLDKALADGDPVHAVIRGIGANHGGRTNSLTVTSPKAQAALIAEVYRAAGVTPDTVGYIEAHGPGTPLGDPIEVAGLKEAFATLAAESKKPVKAGSCGIGSIKTNIGHLEGAAGVAGMVKVIASLRHDALAPNVDFQTLNSLIDLTDSPFRIQAEVTPWPRTAKRPRRAGVSSFGFGGSNAHVLIEEAPEAAAKAGKGDAKRPVVLLPLSARDETRLAAYAADLLRFVEAAPAGMDLRDLAHTYQAGREAMAARVAFVAKDKKTLIEALRAFLAGETSPGVRRPGEPGRSSAKHLRIADRWLGGEDVDWTDAAGAAPARRIHAPTYPFARDRHWMDDTLGDKDDRAVVHPLLHRNVSDFDGQRYVSRFRGSEFFWAEHHVRDVQVLPGVVSLEMARIAYQEARGDAAFTPLRFENVVWTASINAGTAPVTVAVRLRPGRGDEIGFVIETPEAAPGVANGQGNITPLPAEALPRRDVEALRAAATDPIDSAECYARLRERGVHHGPSFQAITELRRGTGFALATLKLPRPLHPTVGLYGLHPVLMDGAIQAWIGLADGVPAGAGVPFACRRIDVLGPCERTMLAHVRPAEGAAADRRFVRLDIDLCTPEGEPRVVFRELALRLVAETDRPAVEPSQASDQGGTLLYAKGAWEARPAVEGGPERETTVLLAGFAPGLAEELAGASGRAVAPLAGDDPADLGGRARTWFGALHTRLSEIMRARSKTRQQVQILVPAELPACLTAPLAALLKTARVESPSLEGSVIAVDGSHEAGRLARIVEAERHRTGTDVEVRYDKDDGRHVWTMDATEAPAVDGAARRLDPAGVYWITGGLGGLGGLFAESLMARGATRIVLTGRRPEPDVAARARLDAWRERGVDVRYVPCDIAERAEVDRLVAWIAEAIGPLKGVVHAAGVLDDGLILTNTDGKMDAVFAPKVSGTLNLDEATAGLDLDFFALCSSVAGVFGNTGQASYAGANAFLDGFAEHRAAQAEAGLRRGATAAIAWPLWADGGMTVDAPSLAALNRRFGTVPLPTEAGMRAFETLVQGASSPRWTVLFGDAARMGAFLRDDGAAEPPRAVAAAVSAPARVVEDDDLLRQTIGLLKDLFADATQMEPAQIKANRKLEEYGLDSIVIVEMTNRLEEKLGPLSKTLFFEYVDLAGIAAHLVETHGDALSSLFAGSPAGPEETGAAPAAQAEAEATPNKPDPAPRETPEAPRGADDRHDIAIVGLSLRVAKADDQETFWEMIANGLHGFEPYPASRWNHNALLHPERDVLGKTVVKTGAFIDGVEDFDPRYFRISQYEAELMSPEVRLFLQASVEAFEDAGYSREYLQSRLGGDVAVIVGSMTNEYDYFGFQNMLVRGAPASGSYTGTLPNMVSYFYGFTGPSYFLDTMCSTASTCVHEAVHMLRAGRCKMALAGGVSLLLHPQKLIATSQEHFTSKTAEVIRGYGLGADGTIVGEGVGALVLKTLADAERDGDHIYAVIKGTDVSNAGVRNGFTVPTPALQARAIEGALADAAIHPLTLGYIEGHGSGTALGDPIEIKALTQAFRKYTDEVQFCPIGTVKSNIAHLLAAAGLAGIVKVLMQMAHGQIAPSLNAEALNPNIPFAETPFYVQRELAPWPRKRDAAGRELPRRAGVTSIGAGGMNSHIIIEEYREPAAARSTAGGPELLVFSAMSEATLRAAIERFLAHVEAHPSLPPADVAYTLQVGKNELPCRLALVADDLAAARRMLSAFLAAPGPQAGLIYTRSILDKEPSMKAAELRELTRSRALDRVAQAWSDGETVDWDLLNDGRGCRRLSLPAYPFERVRCWYPEFPDAPSVLNPLGSRLKLHPFVGANRSDMNGLRYRTDIYLNELLDYVYTVKREQTVLPTVVVDLAAGLARIAGLEGPIALGDLSVQQPMAWRDVKALACAVRPLPGDGGGLRIAVRMENAAGEQHDYAVAVAAADSGLATPSNGSLESLRARAARTLDKAAFYEALGAQGLGFGPYLEVVERADVLDDGAVLCALRADPPQQDLFKRAVLLSAPLLGAAYQALVLAFGDAATLDRAALGRAWLDAGEATHVLVRPTGEARCDIRFLDDAGRAVAALDGLDLRAGSPFAIPAATELAEVPRDAGVDPAPRPDAGDDRRRQVESELREIAAAVLKFDAEEINPRALFYELGFDSISLTRLANEIGAAYGISLAAAIFFECEHIEALSAHLVAHHGVAPIHGEPAPAPAPVAAVARPPQIREATVPVVSVPAVPSPLPSAAPDAVAVVGMAGRFPGSDDVEAFFDHLLAGDDLITDLPLERYGAAYRERLVRAEFVRRGGFLDAVDRFDAAFFKISPVEAERMDPQQRLVLETAWRALEDAGYRPDQLPADTGVCIGVSGHDYADLLQAHGVVHDGYAATGNSLAMVANRLSHFLNVQGPSQAVDTACSSSLVALLRGAEMLRSGRCGAVLVGGVNVTLSVEGFEGPHQAGMLSPEGRCKTFGKDADGYVRGEGVVVLMIKRLADAERDGDHILGVVIGGAENHGGRAGSLTAPNAKAQADLVRRAMAGIDAASIDYIEAHGTGTSLGDPVEVNGLRLAYETLLKDAASGSAAIGLGSVKSNIGHLEAAAGLAGVVKVLMAMRHGVIPPTLHCREINPMIELADTPFSLVQSARRWPRRRGGAGGARPARGARGRAAPRSAASVSAAPTPMWCFRTIGEPRGRRTACRCRPIPSPRRATGFPRAPPCRRRPRRRR